MCLDVHSKLFKVVLKEPEMWLDSRFSICTHLKGSTPNAGATIADLLKVMPAPCICAIILQKQLTYCPHF